MVPELVGFGLVVAALVVLRRVLEIAAGKGSVGIVDPLVEVTDHVVNTVFVGATVVIARFCDGALDLVEERAVHEIGGPLTRARFEEAVEHAHRASAVIIAALRDMRVSIAPAVLFRAHTGLLPLVHLAEAFARGCAGNLGLAAADIALRNHARASHCADAVAFDGLVGGKGPFAAVVHPFDHGGLVAIDAVFAFDVDHPARASAVFSEELVEIHRVSLRNREAESVSDVRTSRVGEATRQ